MPLRKQIFHCAAYAMAIFGLVPIVRAQPGQPTKEQILEVWRERQEKVQTAHFEMNFKHGFHKGSLNIGEAMLGRSDQGEEPSPSRDMGVDGTCSVTVSGGKVRVVADQPVWSGGSKAVYRQRIMDVFDGRLSSWLHEPSASDEPYPSALTERAERSRAAGEFRLLPLFWSFRGDHPQFTHEFVTLRLTGRTVNVSERPCLELTHETRTIPRREVFYLDRERGYVVVRKLTLFNDKPLWQMDVTYSPDAVIGWVPKSWEYVVRAGDRAEVVESGLRTVVRYELNRSVADSEFNLTIPAGTRVHDLTSGDEIMYVMGANGKKGQGIPAYAYTSYDDLARLAPRSTRNTTIVAASAAVLIITAAGWLVLRWRRAKRQPVPV